VALPCRAAALRHRLKHEYLTNTVCSETKPQKLLKSMLYLEKGVPRHQIIRDLLEEMRELMCRPEVGFSPVQLLERLQPFAAFSVDKRMVLKKAVQKQFAEEFGLAARTARLQGKSERFVCVLDEFLNEGKSGSLANGSMDEVQAAARELIIELGDLPKGIWLWPSQESARRDT